MVHSDFLGVEECGSVLCSPSTLALHLLINLVGVFAEQTEEVYSILAIGNEVCAACACLRGGDEENGVLAVLLLVFFDNCRVDEILCVASEGLVILERCN